MSEEQFIESQKECADMLGMSLSEYQDYCKNLKVTDDTKELVEKIKKLQIASFFFLLSNIWHIAKNYNKC